MLLDLHILNVSKAGLFLENSLGTHYPLGRSDTYHISIICFFLGFYWIISAISKAPGCSSLVFAQTSIPFEYSGLLGCFAMPASKSKQ